MLQKSIWKFGKNTNHLEISLNLKDNKHNLTLCYEKQIQTNS